MPFDSKQVLLESFFVQNSSLVHSGIFIYELKLVWHWKFHIQVIQTLSSLEALEKHELHNSNYASDVLTINTLEVNNSKNSKASPKGIYLQRKIDSTLIDYENSLTNIVENVDCKDALKYATKIYEHCEKQLLKTNISESKKYYNLRTKQITAQAINNSIIVNSSTTY